MDELNKKICLFTELPPELSTIIMEYSHFVMKEKLVINISLKYLLGRLSDATIMGDKMYILYEGFFKYYIKVINLSNISFHNLSSISLRPVASFIVITPSGNMPAPFSETDEKPISVSAIDEKIFVTYSSGNAATNKKEGKRIKAYDNVTYIDTDIKITPQMTNSVNKVLSKGDIMYICTDNNIFIYAEKKLFKNIINTNTDIGDVTINNNFIFTICFSRVKGEYDSCFIMTYDLLGNFIEKWNISSSFTKSGLLKIQIHEKELYVSDIFGYVHIYCLENKRKLRYFNVGHNVYQLIINKGKIYVVTNESIYVYDKELVSNHES